MNLLTIIVLLILLFFILNGYRRGFIKTFVSMVSVVVAIILVSIATPHVSQFLKSQTPVYGMILDKCRDAFGLEEKQQEQKSTTENEMDQDAKDSSLDPDNALSRLEQVKIIEELKLPKAIQDMLESNNNKKSYEKLEVEAFTDYIPNYMATLILNIISFVVTFLLVSSFLWIAVMTLDIIANLPILHGINRLLGLVLGLLQGLVFVWMAFLVITVFSNTDFGKQLMLMIYDSPLLNAIYDHNIFLNLLTNAMSYFV